MSNENQLLLQDLSARLPYGVHCCVFNLSKTIKEDNDIIYGIVGDNIVTLKSDKNECYMYYQIKPYLRPLSSMTKKEKEELQEMVKSNPIKPYGKLTNKCDNLTRSVAYGAFDIISYLLSKHFDIKNLIEIGLALKAPEGMYVPELAESKDERIRNFISNELACLRAADEKGTVRYNELTEAIVWVEKQGEQKPAGSEEDERIIEEIINDIECARAINYHAPKEGYEFRENWLRTLKERILPQPKQEWSEEDKYLLGETIKHLEALIRITKKQGSAYSDEIQYYQRDIDWLKSLHLQKQWRPSAEQIKCFKYIVNNFSLSPHNSDLMTDLYIQLNALLNDRNRINC